MNLNEGSFKENDETLIIKLNGQTHKTDSTYYVPKKLMNFLTFNSRSLKFCTQNKEKVKSETRTGANRAERSFFV